MKVIQISLFITEHLTREIDKQQKVALTANKSWVIKFCD